MEVLESEEANGRMGAGASESTSVDSKQTEESSKAMPAPENLAGPSKRKVENKPVEPLEPLDDVLLRRVTRIKEGDNVLLRMPSDTIKAVVASAEGLVHLGKYGSFPTSKLLGLYYDIIYEVVVDPEAEAAPSTEEGEGASNAQEETDAGANFGRTKGKKDRKKNKGKGKETAAPGVKTNPGWRNTLRPFKSRSLIDATIDDVQETNEFIDDSESIRATLLTHEEIDELKAQGVSAEEMIRKQMERHDTFDLKTDFSKEKWRKRKEKKFSQTILPVAPSAANMTSHYLSRAPQSILHLREDTLSQMMTLANIRPDGRYLVVDSTGGLVTSAVMERMGCQGRILTFTDADSPPAWGILSVMNWSERELACVKWLNWLEAEEDYEKPPPPDEDGLPAIASAKTMARNRRHAAQVHELNATRNELHLEQWDGLIIATDLSPLSVLARLVPYLSGSGDIVVYSPYIQALVEVLAYAKRDPQYLAETLTESWTREYQVLPGRTHPMMSTSGTGGYLFHATKVYPAKSDAGARGQKRKRGKPTKPAEKTNGEVAISESSGALENDAEGNAE